MPATVTSRRVMSRPAHLLGVSLLLSTSALAQIDPEDPATCAPCHGAIVAEWGGSAHARSHHEADPIYAALRRLRMEKEGPQVADACAQCHSPRAVTAAAGGPIDHDGALARAGISCAACHTVASLAGEGHGVARHRAAAPGQILGPHDPLPDRPAPHGQGVAAHLRDGITLCLSCHEQLHNPQGVAQCATGLEFGAPGGGYGSATCVSCHMPDRPTPGGAVDRDARHRSHAFLGPRQRRDAPAETCAQPPVALEGELARGHLIVTLMNRTGHRFPTGFPGRVALLALRGYDAAGELQWSNWRNAPTESPESVLGVAFVDAAGQPTLAPYAHGIAADRRLRPGETRTLRFSVPPEVTRVEATLTHQLLAAPLATRLGLDPKAQGAPEKIASASYSLPPAP